ncbi:hypothetical protein Lepto7376_0062 [[Leptolyngbya] sp. PCC 7376]|uniref:capsular polysaccharide export protein, LipB/KpsS family n=1 Tax=[Leptolyngbya] sp. PCC 7376 TaxID=111781 RepID=UPI00029F0CC3|nr:hypothetical protein [[Leptolyngbya] sp. PCC 7376]AFY36521.1 hypothetical protein Lepto7376_0062 [[Leptolyngbya] sp. PCC 7376]
MKIQNILFFNPYGVYPIHFETDLELIKNHLLKGDKITYLVCNGELLSCQANPDHHQYRCNDCIARRKKGFSLLDLTDKVDFLPWKYLSNEDYIFIQKESDNTIKTREELTDFSINQCDIGMSVLSSLIDVTKEAHPDITAQIFFIEKNRRMAMEVYFSIKNHLSNNQYDLFYLFNGRTSTMRPALRAAQELKIQTFVHERSGIINKYTLTENDYPHNLSIRKHQLDLAWNNSEKTQQDKRDVASVWFQAQASGKDQAWFSFTKDQQDKLPISFNSQNTNIVIFNSSENEVATIPGWKNPFYQDQNQGILEIAKNLEPISDLSLYLRVHPNLKYKENSQTKFIQKLKNKFRNLYIIEAQDSCSSYKLLAACDCVITFGSTIGIEAVFHKKTSILAGKSIYEDLGACIVPNSHAELISIIRGRDFQLSDKELEQRKENSLKYAYYMATNGIPFKFFQQESILDISYNGQYITTKPYYLVKVVRDFRKKLNRIRDFIS